VVKCVKTECENESNVIGSCLLIYKLKDILIGNFEVLQEFVKHGVERNKIMDVFCKLR
jgi:hypothetical protein